MKTAFLDTETTADSLSADGQISQLSYILKEGERLRAVNRFFAVERVSEGSARVTGLSAEKLRKLSGGLRFCDAVDEVLEDLSGAVIAAHNFKFDYAFLQRECGGCGRLLRYRDEVCTAKTFAKILREPRPAGGFLRPKLGAICAHYRLSGAEVRARTQELFGEGETWHDARFDATAVMLVLERAEMMGEFAWRKFVR